MERETVIISFTSDNGHDAESNVDDGVSIATNCFVSGLKIHPDENENFHANISEMFINEEQKNPIEYGDKIQDNSPLSTPSKAMCSTPKISYTSPQTVKDFSVLSPFSAFPDTPSR